ncbi:hypothetical protein [Streptomyces sp. RKAG337]|uniref:hypothetical protein n=1 Tax=Streptomyces sp. RKAG337 TaxID=2893404 RepID=UPI002033271A|nr:hypothetical protein [Streptomyces sp. RKAG337]MCM2430912.1 hypothetical protein [Streptomyces sp. RKAG337]
MSFNRRSAERIDRAGICRAYGERPATVDTWVKLLNFPGPLDPEEWDAQQVDQWVEGNRPQSWPARAAQPDAVAVEPAASQTEREVSAVLDGESVGSGELLGKSGLARRYRVSDSTVDVWTRSAGTKPFPTAPEPGRWRVGDVDTWVRNNRAHVWGRSTVKARPW